MPARTDKLRLLSDVDPTDRAAGKMLQVDTDDLTHIYVDPPEGGGGGGGGAGTFCDVFGDDVETTIDVEHNLGTSCVQVGVVEVDSGDALVHGTDYTWLILDDDTVRLVFSSAPDTDDARVVVLASGGDAPVNVWEHIATVSAASNGDTLDIQSIDPAYTAFRLTLRWSGVGDTFVVIRLNNDSGSSAYAIDRWNTVADEPQQQTRSELVWYASSALAGALPGHMEGLITQPSASAPALFSSGVVAHGPGRFSWGTGKWANGSSQKINRLTVLATVGQLAAGSKLILEGTRE